MDEEKPFRNLSFHFTFESGDVHDQSAERGERGGGLTYPISHALIYISYIYLHTLLFCSERGKTILQNTYLWRPDCSLFLSLPFTVSLPNTVDLKWGEKSDDPPLSLKSNQVNEDVSLNQWWTCLCSFLIFFRSSFLLLVQNGPFFFEHFKP